MKCIFHSDIECGHFINDEYRCMIFGSKCENIRYRMQYGTNQFGELVELIFREYKEQDKEQHKINNSIR